MRAQATPKGYHTLNPILRVADAAAALEFYTRVFGAHEEFRRELHGRLLLVVIILPHGIWPPIARLLRLDRRETPEA